MIKREQGLSRGTAILSMSGCRFDYAAPHPDQVNLDDVIRSLAMTVRYRGQCPRFYSVAEHSVLVMQLVGILWRAAVAEPVPESLLWRALMHDAHEAYTGDTPTPQKRAIGAPWREHESAIEALVHEALRIPRLHPDGDPPRIVKQADQVAYELERRFLFGWGDVVDLPEAVESALKDSGALVPPRLGTYYGTEWRDAQDELMRAVLELPIGREVLARHRHLKAVEEGGHHLPVGFVVAAYPPGREVLGDLERIRFGMPGSVVGSNRTGDFVEVVRRRVVSATDGFTWNEYRIAE